MQHPPHSPAGAQMLRQASFQDKLGKVKTTVILLTAVVLGCCRQCHEKSSINISTTSNNPSCIIDTKYPVWFFNPPQGTVTGYYHDTVTSLSDAKIRAAGYHSMRFYGKFRYYEDDRTDDFQDSLSFYFKEPDTLLAESLQVVDSFFMCCTGKIYLLAEKVYAVDTTRVDACDYSLKTKDTPAEKIFATGEYRFEYYNQSLSWMHAEETAVKNLCDQALHRFASLRKKTESELSTTMMKKFDLSTKNIVIEQRIFDAADNICRVTISCNAEDIVPTPSSEVSP
jgi:hypothetical protein